MNLAKTYPEKNVQLIALMSLVIASLPLAFSLPVPIIVAFVLLVVLRFTLVLIEKKGLATWQIFLLAILLAGLVFFNLNLLWGREGGLAVLLLFVTMKSFDGGTYRDWQMFLLFSFFLVIGPLLFDQQVLNAVWMVVSLGSILFSFAVLSSAPIKSALKQTIFALMISAPFMIVLFFAIPRLPEPIMQFPQKQNKQSGLLSDTLSPGSVSELILNNRQIFNAVFEGDYRPNNNQLYWRMIVMPEFDGIAWKAVEKNVIDNLEPNSLGKNIRYSMTLTDQNERIPALDYPLSLDESTKRGFANTILVKRSYTQLRRLELTSNGDASIYENMTTSMRNLYTRLPSNNNPRTQKWAKELADNSESSEEFIKKVLNYLRTGGFEYTLKPDTLDHTNNQADELLFVTKNGFCEHFSSAFAVAMRAGGLPSRVVVGYQGGEFYPENGFWQIKGKDAHAWTEVWQPETKSWLRVDPTLAVSATRIDVGIDDALPDDLAGLGGGNSRWNMAKINAEFIWQQWVVGFNAEKQRDLFSRLGLEKVNAFTVFIVLCIGGFLSFLPVIFWWIRFLRRQGNALTDGFNLLKQKLFDEDYAIQSLGPLEVLTELEDRGETEVYEKVKPLIDRFIQLSYQSVEKPKKNAALNWLKQVKKLKV